MKYRTVPRGPYTLIIPEDYETEGALYTALPDGLWMDRDGDRVFAIPNRDFQDAVDLVAWLMSTNRGENHE